MYENYPNTRDFSSIPQGQWRVAEAPTSHDLLKFAAHSPSLNDVIGAWIQGDESGMEIAVPGRFIQY